MKPSLLGLTALMAIKNVIIHIKAVKGASFIIVLKLGMIN